MRDPDPGDRADDLGGDVGAGQSPADLAPHREDERYGRVEVRAGQRPEYRDQHNQTGAGRQCVAKERDRGVSGGEGLAHDARADDDGQ